MERAAAHTCVASPGDGEERSAVRLGFDRDRTGSLGNREPPCSCDNRIVAGRRASAGRIGVFAMKAVNVEGQRTAVLGHNAILAVLQLAGSASKFCGGRNRASAAEDRPDDALPYAGSNLVDVNEERRGATSLKAPDVELDRIVRFRQCRNASLALNLTAKATNIAEANSKTRSATIWTILLIAGFI